MFGSLPHSLMVTFALLRIAAISNNLSQNFEHFITPSIEFIFECFFMLLDESLISSILLFGPSSFFIIDRVRRLLLVLCCFFDFLFTNVHILGIWDYYFI